MSGLSHSTNHSAYPDSRPFLRFLPTAWKNATRRVDPGKQGSTGALSQVLTESDPLPLSKRLVVIVPDIPIDVFTLPRRIWRLASPDRQVLLLSKPLDDENQFTTHMNLTSLAALVRDPHIMVQTQVVAGMSIEQAVQKNLQPDDVLVCFEEHRVSRLFKNYRLVDRLAATSQVPIYTLKGPASEEKAAFLASLLDLIFLIFGLASIIAFFALEVWIDRTTSGAAHSFLQILAVCVEVWVVAACVTRSIRI